MTEFTLSHIPTSLGTLLLVTDEKGAVRACEYEDYEPRMLKLLRLHYGAVALRPGPAPAAVANALTRYFAGDLTTLDELPCATNGTDFQRLVWAALRRIKPGTTLSYGQLAAQLGRPQASRAVGLANGSNPVSIIVPCHRVIGANGALTGYAGGIARKQWLLAHEGALQRPSIRA